MAQPPDDPLLIVSTNGILLASAAIWIYLASKWRRDGALLQHAPRRPVPWGPGATVLALLFAAMTIASGQSLDLADTHHAVPDPAESAQQIIGSVIPVVMVSGIFVLAVAVVSRALPSDLGLPATMGALTNDVRIGVVACLAAVLPVFGVLGLLQYFLGLKEASHHPLVESVVTSKDFDIFVLALAAAVVVAPVYEEITFRLLLQGWLEKWDDRRRRTAGAPITNASADEDETSAGDDATAAPEELPIHADSRGWLPILLSSIVFAAAHYGYGPEPVPIFILALVLGYVYQRTHRIVPCMVAHALFNLLNMAALWRMVLHAA